MYAEHTYALRKGLNALRSFGKVFQKPWEKALPVRSVASHGLVSRAAPYIWISAVQLWFLMTYMPSFSLNRANGVISI